MPGFDTVANLVSDAAMEMGLVSAAIADPFASTDANIIRLVRMTKTVGRRLAKSHPWSHLKREGSITTANGVATYALPGDWGRVVDVTFWNRTSDLPVPAGVSSGQWQMLKAISSTGVYKVLRVWQDLFYVHPTPTAAEDIFFEYISRNWGAASFDKETPSAAADVIQFDPLLFVAALKLKWRAEMRFDTTVDEREFQTAWRLVTGQEGAAPVFSLNRPAAEHLIDAANAPETGYGT